MKYTFFGIVALLLAVGCQIESVDPVSNETLLIVNSKTTDVRDAREVLTPYLDHLGVAYTELDLSVEMTPEVFGSHPLIIVGHKGVANKYGFKPWVGLFIYNITPDGVNELREYINVCNVTASPHAFGRPPRPESSADNFDAYYEHQMVDSHCIPEYYYPDAIPYLSDYYDEFIYFNHNDQKPYPDDVAQRTMNAVDAWYEANAPLPMARYLVAHWSIAGSNVVDHFADKWPIEFVTPLSLDIPWSSDKPSPKIGPFRLYDAGGIDYYGNNEVQQARPIYNADFVNLAGREFFAFSSVITDLTGYEWQPNNEDIEGTIDRGIKTLKRGLDSKSIAVLFTHETDYLFRIAPDNFDAIMEGVSQGISTYQPAFLTTDDAIQLARAFQTSSLSSYSVNVDSGDLTAVLDGTTDMPTSFFMYTDQMGDIVETAVEIPQFQGKTTVSVQY